MDIEEMTSKGGGDTHTHTHRAKFGRQNSEQRCLSRPDVRFSPSTRPLLELPNLSLSPPAPQDAASCGQRRRKELWGSFGSFLFFFLSLPPSPHPAGHAGLEQEKEIWDNGPGIGSDATVGELLSATRCLCAEPRPGHRRRPVLEEPEQGRYEGVLGLFSLPRSRDRDKDRDGDKDGRGRGEEGGGRGNAELSVGKGLSA